jgi:MbtH protein
VEKQYQVVVNDEGQFSIWPADTAPPAGWTASGPRGNQLECLAYLGTVWKVLTPKSLRQPTQ